MQQDPYELLQGETTVGASQDMTFCRRKRQIHN
jgi:hypothetical protein